MTTRASLSAVPESAPPVPTPVVPQAQKGKLIIAADISGLKQRFLAGTLQESDWDDMVALLDAADTRRKKNKEKQKAWRDGRRKRV